MKRLIRVEITDIKGIERLSIEPGAITIIEGANGVGKSSVLDAVTAVFEGGHDPTLIRQGAQRGTVVLKLDDGTTITKTITPSTSDLQIVAPDGLPVKKPKTFLEALAAGMAFDPVQFLSAKPKDRAAFVLAAMPIQFSHAEITEALTKAKLTEVKSPGNLDLPGLDDFRKRVFEQRTSTNRTVREMEKTINALRKSMPEKPKGDWQAALAEAEHVLAAEETGRKMTENDVEIEYRRDIEIVDEAYRTKLAELNVWRDAEKQKAHEKNLEYTRGISLEFGPRIEKATADLAALREMKAQADRAAGATEQINAFGDQQKEAFHRAEAFTAALAAIDALKLEKLKALPVDGLVVQDGDLAFNGIPFSQINTSQQVLLAVQLASLATGELGLMVLDRAESLDDATWGAFIEAFRESGLQVIAARVTEGERQVTIAA